MDEYEYTKEIEYCQQHRKQMKRRWMIVKWIFILGIATLIFLSGRYTV
ncbi:MAG: hypothetical protein ACK5MN_03250 [Lachnospiraceae bacterium]